MAKTLEAQLAELRSRSLYRRLREIDSPQQPALEFVGRKLLNFSSNDYLGLASEPALKDAACEAIAKYGVGSGASRLICGTLSPHVRLEEKLAEFKKTAAALTFSSGHAAAIGTVPALVGREDVVIVDKLAHASLIDAARLSGATVRVFPHNHLGQLESHLQWTREHHPDSRVLVITESVFSMDGDRAPLDEMVHIKSRYGAWLLVDEAHAVGVIGPEGAGLAAELGIGSEIEVQMGTLSKALGVSGGYICGSRKLIDLLINRARSFIFSTAPPPASAAASAAAIDFVRSSDGEQRRSQLWTNVRSFSSSLPLFPREPQSAILPIMIGSEEIAISAAEHLVERGFLVPAIRYPTVAKGRARLRVTFSSQHTRDQIGALVQEIRRLHLHESSD
jgi:8-amino-7-oxononanoate synthase